MQKVQMAGMLERKEKMMGFGHAIYARTDHGMWLQSLGQRSLADEFGVILHFMTFQWLVKRIYRGIAKSYFVIADFFHASAYPLYGHTH